MRRPRHAHHGKAAQGQARQQIAIAGVVHQHHVAGACHAAGHQIQRLAGPLGQQDMFSLGGNAGLAQPVFQIAAQRRVALRVAVLGQRAVVTGGLLERALAAVAVKPLRRKPTAPRLQGVGVGFIYIARQPVRIHRQFRHFWPALAHRAATALLDKKPGPTPGVQHPQRRQPVVGFHHGGWADLQLRGQLAD